MTKTYPHRNVCGGDPVYLLNGTTITARGKIVDSVGKDAYLVHTDDGDYRVWDLEPADDLGWYASSYRRYSV